MTTERILKVNTMMVEAYLQGKFIKMENCRILLNHYIDLAIEEKENKVK